MRIGTLFGRINSAILLLCLSGSAYAAQGESTPIRGGATLPSTCQAAAAGVAADVFALSGGTLPGIYLCTATDTWTWLGAIGKFGKVHGFWGTFPGGGQPLVVDTVYTPVPVDCTISAWTILISPGDTATFTTWKVATGGSALPTVSDTISTIGNSISTGTVIHSTNVTDFTSLSVSANDIIGIHLNAVGGVATWAHYFVECDLQ